MTGDRLSADEGERILSLFRARFEAEPLPAFREWYRAQEELAEAGEKTLSVALADDLWAFLAATGIAGDERGRLFNNAGTFYGKPGVAADLGRAEACFRTALEAWSGDEEKRGRALHNLGSALSTLAADAGDLARGIASLESALEHRGDHEIARAVTLHHLGIARRRLAERSSEAGAELERSADALSEALVLRERHGLAAGVASSRFQLAATLAALGREGEARATFALSAEELAGVGRIDEADLARRLARE